MVEKLRVNNTSFGGCKNIHLLPTIRVVVNEQQFPVYRWQAGIQTTQWRMVKAQGFHLFNYNTQQRNFIASINGIHFLMELF
jgi:hypothetical protein